MQEHGVLVTGGKQYLIQPGDLVVVERLAIEPGQQTTFEDRLARKTITASVVDHSRKSTVRVVKFRNKTRSYRRHGHRQLISSLRIESVM